MILNKNQEAFFALVRAGLWEKDVHLLPYGEMDYEEIMRLAEEQSVVGLITAGLEHVTDVKVPQEWLLQFIGQTLQIEEQNKDMNDFVAMLIEKLRKANIYAILVKGQGIAQCYERPLWRASGDVDLYLSDSNYQLAKEYLPSLASHVDNEEKNLLHLGMTIDSWIVELHGTMYGEVSKRMNRGLDEVHQSIYNGGNVRSWDNNDVTVFLPSADNDVIIVFTHFLQHFFIEGVGLRQICDWCRLLWRYRSELDVRLLEQRLRRMGLMSEWKVFYHLATKYLGMPDEVSRLTDVESATPRPNSNKFGSSHGSIADFKFQDSGPSSSNRRLDKKAEKVLKRILKSGNFGHNNDLSYRSKYTGIRYKIVAMWRRLTDFASLVPVFPMDAPKFFMSYLIRKV